MDIIKNYKNNMNHIITKIFNSPLATVKLVKNINYKDEKNYFKITQYYKNKIEKSLNENPNINKCDNYRISLNYDKCDLQDLKKIEEELINSMNRNININKIHKFSDSYIKSIKRVLDLIQIYEYNYKNDYTIIKTDIKKAYENVMWKHLFNFLKNDIFISTETYNKIKYILNIKFIFNNIIYKKTQGLPLGLNLSNILFTYYMLNIFNVFHDRLNFKINNDINFKIHHFDYEVFVDDILFIYSDVNGYDSDIFNLLINTFNDFNLSINPKKQGYYIHNQPLIYLGKFINLKKNNVLNLNNLYHNNYSLFKDIIDRIKSDKNCISLSCHRCIEYKNMNNKDNLYFMKSYLCHKHKNLKTIKQNIKDIYDCSLCNNNWIINNSYAYNSLVSKIINYKKDPINNKLKFTSYQKNIFKYVNLNLIHPLLFTKSLMNNIYGNINYKENFQIKNKLERLKNLIYQYKLSTSVIRPSICHIYKIYLRTKIDLSDYDLEFFKIYNPNVISYLFKNDD